VSTTNLNLLTYEQDFEFKESLYPPTGRGRRLGDLWAKRHGSSFVQTEVRPIFRDIESALIEEISKSDVVVGCVAWLTNRNILQALQGRASQFVVQVEDWLRPDSDNTTLAEARHLIKTLTPLHRWQTGYMTGIADGFISPLRISGEPAVKNRNTPRMHHKFAVFGNYADEDDHPYGRFDFHTVFTGSFNWTRNATNSLENGVFMKGEVVEAYHREWYEVMLSARAIREEWWSADYGWNCDDEEYGLREGT
jgi:hypothetical protein